MYDDLAQTQQPPPLEWCLVHAVIPSIALTLLLRLPAGPDCDCHSPRSRLPTRSDNVKAISMALSITTHVAVGAAVLFGSAKTGQSDAARPLQQPISYLELVTHHNELDGGEPLPGTFLNPVVDTRSMALPPTFTADGILPKTGAPTSWLSSGVQTGRRAVEGNPWGAAAGDAVAEMLTAPLPAYPELLRQAGVQGKVVLEAVVDTTGRVLPLSISVVSATHPGFVAPARQALLASLFRPALAGGKPVRMKVRIPYDFTIRTGMGRAR
jgi:TonB family protein